jgi:hypothetical protein
MFAGFPLFTPDRKRSFIRLNCPSGMIAFWKEHQDGYAHEIRIRYRGIPDKSWHWAKNHAIEAKERVLFSGKSR